MQLVESPRAVAGQLEQLVVLLLPPLRVQEGGGVEAGQPVDPVAQSVHQLSLPVINKHGLAQSQVVQQVTPLPGILTHLQVAVTGKFAVLLPPQLCYSLQLSLAMLDWRK